MPTVGARRFDRTAAHLHGPTASPVRQGVAPSRKAESSGVGPFCLVRKAPGVARKAFWLARKAESLATGTPHARERGPGRRAPGFVACAQARMPCARCFPARAQGKTGQRRSSQRCAQGSDACAQRFLPRAQGKKPCGWHAACQGWPCAAGRRRPAVRAPCGRTTGSGPAASGRRWRRSDAACGGRRGCRHGRGHRPWRCRHRIAAGIAVRQRTDRGRATSPSRGIRACRWRAHPGPA